MAGSAAAEDGDIVDDARRWAPDTERYIWELVDRAIQQAPGSRSAERRSRPAKRSAERPAAAKPPGPASPGIPPAAAGAATLGARVAATQAVPAVPPTDAQVAEPHLPTQPQPAPPVQAPSLPAADPLPERIPPGAALVRLVDDRYATRADLEGEVRVIDVASGKPLRKLALRRGTLVLPADLLKGEQVLRVLAILRDKGEVILIEAPAAQIDSRYLTPDAIRPLAPIAPHPAAPSPYGVASVPVATLTVADPSLPECADRDPLVPLSAPPGAGPQAKPPPCLRSVPGPACRLALAQRRVGETEIALRALKTDPAMTGADRPLDRTGLCASPRPPSPTDLGTAAPGPLADLDRALTEADTCVNAVGTWLSDLRCERADCASPRDRQIEQIQLRTLPDLNQRAIDARERLERIRVLAQTLERRYAQHRKYCGGGGG